VLQILSSGGESDLASTSSATPTAAATVKFRDIVRRVEEDGCVLVAQRGSHRQYEHPTKPGKVTVAGKPSADVPTGTATNFLRQAGLRRSKG
jgi:predicted RNA binding protein YcfA (HicA-like mRNA interferase family)